MLVLALVGFMILCSWTACWAAVCHVAMCFNFAMIDDLFTNYCELIQKQPYNNKKITLYETQWLLVFLRGEAHCQLTS